MKTSATNKRIRELVTRLRDGQLVPRPEFQRRIVWTNIDKNNFIETVLKGFPFPEIYVADGSVDLETGEGTQVLVDGQQRVTTLFEYFVGAPSLKLRGGLPSYAALVEQDKLDFLSYEVAVRDLGLLSRAQIIEVFQRINSTSYSLNEMEINNAVFNGQLKTLAEEFASNEFFERHRLFTNLDLRRMGDVRFVLTLLITMMAGYFNRDDQFEKYLNDYNDELQEQVTLRQRFLKVLAYMDDCQFGERSRIWKKLDFFSVFCELDYLLDALKAPSPERANKALEAFFALVDLRDGDANKTPLAQEYEKAVIQGSNDRLNRVRRGKIIRDLLLAA